MDIKTRLKKLEESMPDFDSRFCNETKAIEALDNIEKISRNPVRIAGLVNRRLERHFDEISYPATPERVSGLVYALTHPDNYEGRLFTHLPDEILSILEKNRDRELGIFSLNYTGIKTSPVLVSRSVVYPYFSHANYRGITTDLEFGESVSDYFKSFSKKIRRRFNLRDLKAADTWVKKMQKVFTRTDWKDVLSMERYLQSQNEDIEFELALGLSEADIVEKIFQFGYENQPDYRRYALARWIQIVYKKGVRTYDDSLQYAVDSLQERQGRLFRLRELSAPKFVVDDNERLVKSAEFIMEVLPEYRGFVEGIIKK